MSQSMSQSQIRTKVHVRWMIRRDFDAVLAIERRCFSHPWQEDDFAKALRQRNVIGMVAERDERIIGFMVYALHKKRIELWNFAVDPEHRRRGVGTQMIDKLLGKLSSRIRTRLEFEVSDKNLAGHLFLKAMGFQAVEVLPDVYYDGGHGDAYLFRYRWAASASAAVEAATI